MSDPSLMNNLQARQRTSEQAGEEYLATHPWIRHYQAGVPAQIAILGRPLTWLLDSTASHYPGHTAIIYYGTKLTYAQLSSQANRFAIALYKLGVRKGDRVAIALPNIPQYPIVFYGALRAGAVVVPTNPLYTAHEMQHQLVDAGAKVIVMLDTFYPTVRQIRKETALEHVIVTSPSDYLSPVLRQLYPLSQRGVKNPEPRLTERELHEDATLHVMRELLATHSKGGVELFNLPAAANSDELAVLQYTGGTTGLAKGAMLTHRNLLSNAFQTRYWTPDIRLGQEVTLCAAPFFHSYGMTVGMNLSILGAATMVLVPRFKAKDIVAVVRRYRPTLFPGIPTMYIALMREVGKHSDYMRSIKYCISGAAPLPKQVKADFEAMTHGQLVEGYGLSEASPVTHCNPFTDENHDGSIGLPLPNIEAAILDHGMGTLLPVGQEGEIGVRGPNIMKGYWQREGETQAIFHDGWMRTGDIGKMDEEGFFYVVDRAKDMILASGFNVYPREVEEVLYRHSAILEAAVVGVPDAYRGETVGAYVVLKSGFEPSEKTRQEILAFCKQELTAYKVPKKLEFRDSLPKTLVGKVLRRELRKQ